MMWIYNYKKVPIIKIRVVSFNFKTYYIVTYFSILKACILLIKRYFPLLINCHSGLISFSFHFSDSFLMTICIVLAASQIAAAMPN